MFTDSQIRYLLRETFRALSHLKTVSLVSTLIMGVALTMLALFTLITINLHNVARSFQNEIEIAAFLEEDISGTATQEMQGRILEHHSVESVSYVSKEDALKDFQAQLGSDSDLLNVLDENPLPASLRIRLLPEFQSSEQFELMASWLREMPGVQEVRYGDQWVQRLERYVRAFLVLDLLVGGLVVVSALFVVSNTVRLTVLARKRTIEVMRLVGATDWFIRTPFILEGGLQGAVAAGLAMAVLWGVHQYASRLMGPIIFYDAAQIAGFVALCAIISAFGSLSSLRRFLRL